MNNNFSKQLREISQMLLTCADEFDYAMKDHEEKICQLQARQDCSEHAIQKQDKFIKGIKDLLADYN